jgi:Zn-dependent M28 family amino/carboxypeptidase
MKKIFLLILISAAAVAAQTPATAPTPELYSAQTLNDLKNIQQATLQSDYAYKQVAYLSNNIGPRLTGSPQAARAVEYVAAELRKLGLEVRLEKVMVPHWVRGEEKGELVQFPGMAPGTVQKIVLCALGGSVATPAEGITAEVVVVGSFAELAALGKEKIAGKIVLFNNKFNREMALAGQSGTAYGQAVAYRFAGAGAAAPFGALAALVRSAGGSQNRLAHTGAMGYPDGVTKIPTAAVSNEDADLIAYLAAQGATKIHLTLTPQTLPDTESFNVIGDLKGSEKPDEVVIVSGHLDSWDLGRGSIDDGAGVAVAMQTANILQQLKLKPKRTVRVIAWMNEENGGRGSAAYAADEAANIAKHFAAIESDFGAGHPLGFAFAGKGEALPFFAPISNVLLSQGAFRVETQANVGADTAPLTRAGVPSFAPLSDGRFYFDYHHTAADTLDKIEPKALAENASVLAVLAYALANLEQPLPR